jgi:hypothetical protein
MRRRGATYLRKQYEGRHRTGLLSESAANWMFGKYYATTGMPNTAFDWSQIWRHIDTLTGDDRKSVFLPVNVLKYPWLFRAIYFQLKIQLQLYLGLVRPSFHTLLILRLRKFRLCSYRLWQLVVLLVVSKVSEPPTDSTFGTEVRWWNA